MSKLERVAVTTAEKTDYEAQGFKVVEHLPCLGGSCEGEHQIWCGCPQHEGEWRMEKVCTHSVRSEYDDRTNTHHCVECGTALA